MSTANTKKIWSFWARSND